MSAVSPRKEVAAAEGAAACPKFAIGIDFGATTSCVSVVANPAGQNPNIVNPAGEDEDNIGDIMAHAAKTSAQIKEELFGSKVLGGLEVNTIANDMGNRLTPSFVSFGAEESSVGDPALSARVKNYANTIGASKRLLGLDFSSEAVQEDVQAKGAGKLDLYTSEVGSRPLLLCFRRFQN